MLKEFVTFLSDIRRNYIFFYFFNFYCYSITVVCLLKLSIINKVSNNNIGQYAPWRQQLHLLSTSLYFYDLTKNQIQNVYMVNIDSLRSIKMFIHMHFLIGLNMSKFFVLERVRPTTDMYYIKTNVYPALSTKTSGNINEYLWKFYWHHILDKVC